MSNSKVTAATRNLIAAYGAAAKAEYRLRQELAAAEVAARKAYKKAIAAYRRARPDLSERDAEFVLGCLADELAMQG